MEWELWWDYDGEYYSYGEVVVGDVNPEKDDDEDDDDEE